MDKLLEGLSTGLFEGVTERLGVRLFEGLFEGLVARLIEGVTERLGARLVEGLRAREDEECEGEDRSDEVSGVECPSSEREVELIFESKTSLQLESLNERHCKSTY